ncbi:MAG TPA: GRP family sugar transporter [Prolixibacteraceae bacterium]|nr:GRP family sugar transporter [Prolixibacteraceae bacterium]
MVIINSYSVAILLTIITMLCWGSWGNTQKLATKTWPFQLFYWDFTFGILILSLILGLTMGSAGSGGRSFIPDLFQASLHAILLALIGGVIFNIANLLLVAAIDIAGLAVAFPIGIGLALVQGVIVNYMGETNHGNSVLLFSGVALVALAIVMDALAYRKLSANQGTTKKGIVLSLLAGFAMGFFYRFVADSMFKDFGNPEPGMLSPYTAVFIFSVGILISNFLWNTIFMYKPIKGEPVKYSMYFTMGTPKLHLIGILGGIIWGIGMSLNIIASGTAGTAVAYGLGQGATLVSAIWGVFIWKEFAKAPKGTNILLAAMFVLFVAGLSLIIISKI